MSQVHNNTVIWYEHQTEIGQVVVENCDLKEQIQKEESLSMGNCCHPDRKAGSGEILEPIRDEWD